MTDESRRSSGARSRSRRRTAPSCGLRHIQLYTPPGRPAIAVEPFSSPPNALNLLAEGHEHVDVRELPPAAEASFHMALALSVQLGARGSG